MWSKEALKASLRLFNLSQVSNETGIQYMRLWRFVRQNGDLSEEQLKTLGNLLDSKVAK